MPTRSREEYFNLPLKVDESSGTIGKMFVLVIYDISDNRRRASLAKILAGFGYRVQESAFEAMLWRTMCSIGPSPSAVIGSAVPIGENRIIRLS